MQIMESVVRWGVMGTIFHVSPAGDDASSGLTPAQPFATLRYASARLGEGDTLLLQRNGTWFDDQLLIRSAHNISIGSYGNTSLPRPRIHSS